MKEMCLPCYGTGQIRCLVCGGAGSRRNLSVLSKDCIKCKGTGQGRCSPCRGSGFIGGDIPREKIRESRVQQSLPVVL